jgi:hypothetical protein
MKRSVAVIICGLISAVSVSAGQLYGSLKEDGRSLPANVRFEIRCRAQSYPGQTDGNGAYAINAEKGKCTLTVYYKGQSPAADIYSYDNPVRYDFDLVVINGQYALRRK